MAVLDYSGLPSYITEDEAKLWIHRGTVALEYHNLPGYFSERVAGYMIECWIKKTSSGHGAKNYLSFVQDKINMRLLEKKELEEMFWALACSLYKDSHYAIPGEWDDIVSVLCLAEDYTIDEWGMPV